MSGTTTSMLPFCVRADTDCGGSRNDSSMLPFVFRASTVDAVRRRPMIRPSSFDTVMSPLMSSSSMRAVVAVDVDRCGHPAHPHRAGSVDRDRAIGRDRHGEVDVAPRRHEHGAVARAVRARRRRPRSTRRSPATRRSRRRRRDGVAGGGGDRHRTAVVARRRAPSRRRRRTSSARCAPRGRGC